MTTNRMSDDFGLLVAEGADVRAGTVPAARGLGARATFLMLWTLLASFAVLTLSGLVATWSVFEGRLGTGQRMSTGAVVALALLACGLVTAVGGLGRHRPAMVVLLCVSLVECWGAAVALGLAGEHVNLVQLGLAALALPLAWALGPVGGARLAPPERVLIVGSGRVTERVEDLCQRQSGARVELVGFVDEDPFEVDGCGTECLGTVNDLPGVIARHNVDRIIVAWSIASDERIMSRLRDCEGVRIDVVPRMFELLDASPRLASVGGLPLLGIHDGRPARLAQATKRAMDVVGASALLVIFAPVLALVSAAILVVDGRPVMFRQERVGRGLGSFRIAKFRTMGRGAEQSSAGRMSAVQDGELSIEEAVELIKSEGTAQLTRTGGLLRTTSLDELPQLWNVLRGEMSLVGPRPLRDFEVESLTGWELRRQAVRPGITGLWQTLGRSELSWSERMQLDYRYVRNWSLRGDLQILLRTIPAVLSRKGSF